MKGGAFERVTVTLPADLVREIDRRENNRRRREELRKSLQNPHSECAALAEDGLAEWARSLPQEGTESLVNADAGSPVRWVPGEGWVEDRE